MNEKQYLETLNEQLGKLNEKERRDIQRDFEEYFENGRQEGKTTEEIIEGLGKPQDIAKDLLAAYNEEDFVESISLPELKNATDYKSIQINVKGSNFYLKSTDRDQAYLEVKDKDNRTETAMEVKGDTLVVTTTRKEVYMKILFITFIGDIGKSDVTLYVPAQMYAKIDVRNDNGNIFINGIHSNEYKLESDNGRVVCEQTKGNKIYAESDNGRIIFTNIEVVEAEGKTQNGRVIAEDSKAQQFKLSTSNGKIQLTNLEGAVRAKTSNGSIEAHMKRFTANSRLKTDNGSIKLYSPQPLQNIEIDCSTNWGSSTIYGEDTKHYADGTRDAVLELRSANGTLKVAIEE